MEKLKRDHAELVQCINYLKKELQITNNAINAMRMPYENKTSKSNKKCCCDCECSKF